MMNKNASEKLYRILTQNFATSVRAWREELELELDEAVDAMVKGVNGCFHLPIHQPSYPIQLVIKASNHHSSAGDFCRTSRWQGVNLWTTDY